jgi:hypothetical protein
VDDLLAEIEDSNESNQLEYDEPRFEKRGFYNKRNCICRTALTAKNSRHKGRLRKYCSCMN